jgi:hypothetical protein
MAPPVRHTLLALVLQGPTLHREHPSTHLFRRCGADDGQVVLLDFRCVTGLGQWVRHIIVPGGGQGG